MKTKKLFISALALTMLLPAYGKADDCSHTPGEWGADLENHWQVCEECGEKLDSEVHTLNEENYCEVCQKGVCDFGDGTYGIYGYDEQGALCEDSYYGEDGELISRYRYVFEYNEDGTIKSEKDYIYDPAFYGEEEMLTAESSYLPCENLEYGEFYQAESTLYLDDGSKIWTEYAENSDALRVVEYDADGNETSVSRYEYENDDEGERIYMAIYVDEALSYEEFSMPVPNSSSVITKQVYYDAEGAVEYLTEYEYEFDDMGNLLHQTAYENSVLDWECVYEADEDGFTYLAKEIDYDENGELISEIKYDVEGNVIE